MQLQKHSEGLGDFVQGIVTDYNNGTYLAEIPCNEQLNTDYYKLQIFMLRNSEAITAIYHSDKIIHIKARKFQAVLQQRRKKRATGSSQESEVPEADLPPHMRPISSHPTVSEYETALKSEFEKGQSTFCAPFIPEQLPGGDISKVCPVSTIPGREWFCRKPKNGHCGPAIWYGNKILSEAKGYLKPNWFPSYIFNKYNFSNTYDDLVYENLVRIEKASSPASASNSEPSPAFQKSPGFWKDFHWQDRVFPKYSDYVLKKDVMKNRIFVKVGDSISGQVLSVFIQESKGSFRNGIEKRKKREVVRTFEYYAPGYQIHTETDAHTRRRVKRFDRQPGYYGFDFLGLEEYFQPDCLPGNGWAPALHPWTANNASVVSIKHGNPIGKNECPGKAIYTGEIIERMIQYNWFSNSTHQYIFFFTHGAHFASLNPIIYHNRLLDIKNQVILHRQAEKNLYSPQAGNSSSSRASKHKIIKFLIC